MNVRQLSVFAENKPGRLANLIGLLAQGGIDLRALSIADTSDFGIVRIIADDADKAVEVLKKNNVLVSLTPVVAVKIPDKCGALAKLLNCFSESGVNIEYMYAFFSRDDENAYMALRTDNEELCLRVIKDNGYETVTSSQLGIK